jgi:orotidine-5'-phosphate decarboxylase
MSKSTSYPAPRPEERLIFALDGMTPAEARVTVRQLKGAVHFFKVGMELFIQGGWNVIDELAHENVKLFLDLKLLDTPGTVSMAFQRISAQKGVVFATIHAFNTGLKQAVRDSVGKDLRIFAVTLLTSHDDSDLRDLGFDVSARDYVMRMADRAAEMNCDGVVASGREVKEIKDAHPHLLVITPAIRPKWSQIANDDQKRVTTPAEAIANGADYIVVGRPIRTFRNSTGEIDPLEAAERIQDEIMQALEGESVTAPVSNNSSKRTETSRTAAIVRTTPALVGRG